MDKSRCSKVEKDRRVAQVVGLISNGVVTSELVRFITTEWGVSRRHADNYIAAAREVIIADIDLDRKVVVAEMMHTCREIIKKGMQGGNYNVVLGAMNRIAALGGLDPK